MRVRAIPPHVQRAIFSGSYEEVARFGKRGGQNSRKNKKAEEKVELPPQPIQLELVNVSDYPD